jgi:hypothetical protein
MFRTQKTPAWPPAIDLATIRETLIYIESDLKRVPGLEAAASALKSACTDIETIEKTRNEPRMARFVPFASRFIGRN